MEVGRKEGFRLVLLNHLYKNKDERYSIYLRRPPLLRSYKFDEIVGREDMYAFDVLRYV